MKATPLPIGCGPVIVTLSARLSRSRYCTPARVRNWTAAPASPRPVVVTAGAWRWKSVGFVEGPGAGSGNRSTMPAVPGRYSAGMPGAIRPYPHSNALFKVSSNASAAGIRIRAA